MFVLICLQITWWKAFCLVCKSPLKIICLSLFVCVYFFGSFCLCLMSVCLCLCLFVCVSLFVSVSLILFFFCVFLSVYVCMCPFVLSVCLCMFVFVCLYLSACLRLFHKESLSMKICLCSCLFTCTLVHFCVSVGVCLVVYVSSEMWFVCISNWGREIDHQEYTTLLTSWTFCIFLFSQFLCFPICLFVLIWRAAWTHWFLLVSWEAPDPEKKTFVQGLGICHKKTASNQSQSWNSVGKSNQIIQIPDQRAERVDGQGPGYFSEWTPAVAAGGEKVSCISDFAISKT